MTLAEFGEHAQHHPEIDRELDDRLEARAREGSCVIESRLAGWLATRADLLAVRVWVDCDEAVRAARVAERDGTSPEQAQRDNAERAALEHARYQAVYDIDLDDRTPYDLVLDSTVDLRRRPRRPGHRRERTPPSADLPKVCVHAAVRHRGRVSAPADRRRSTAGLGRRRRRRGGRRR